MAVRRSNAFMNEIEWQRGNENLVSVSLLWLSRHVDKHTWSNCRVIIRIAAAATFVISGGTSSLGGVLVILLPRSGSFGHVAKNNIDF